MKWATSDQLHSISKEMKLNFYSNMHCNYDIKPLIESYNNVGSRLLITMHKDDGLR